MESKKIDQKEYLKRYFSKKKDDKKTKKKKKPKLGPKTVKIIDDDVDLNKLTSVNDEDIDIYAVSEYAPQIVGVIDERAPADFQNKNKWKILTDEDGDLSISKIDQPKSLRTVDNQPNPEHKSSTAISNGRSDSDKSDNQEKDTQKKKTKRKKDSSSDDSDLSPPRSSRKPTGSKSSKYDDFDVDSRKSSKHPKKLNQSDSDLSPPRRKKSKNANDSDSDMSLPRNESQQKDKYYSKSRKDESSKYKSSKQNRSKNYDSDLSPPRNSRKTDNRSMRNESQRSKSRWDTKEKSPTPERYRDKSKSSRDSGRKARSSRWDDDSEKSPEPVKQQNKKMKKTLDGTSAGLQNLKSLKEEEEAQKKREAEMMKRMNKEVSGYGQETVVRDRKTGRKRDFDREVADIREREREQEAINEKYAEWGGGLKQNEARQQKLKRDQHEMSKPLARYAGDEDLEAELKGEEREDDPMLNYMKKKRAEENKHIPQKPKYKGSFMPNRFGIPPGHRWDGVDRSTGYEKKWFEAKNAKKALAEEAFKWSTADL